MGEAMSGRRPDTRPPSRVRHLFDKHATELREQLLDEQTELSIQLWGELLDVLEADSLPGQHEGAHSPVSAGGLPTVTDHGDPSRLTRDPLLATWDAAEAELRRLHEECEAWIAVAPGERAEFVRRRDEQTDRTYAAYLAWVLGGRP